MKERNNNIDLSTGQFSDLPAGSLRILQISDTHLFGELDGSLAGMNTENSLQQVLQLVHDAVLPVDLVLATGDLVHDVSETGYRRFQNYLMELDAPVYYLPGNHDDLAAMDRYLANDRISMPSAGKQGDWVFVMLDSSIPNSAKGHLAESELEKLETALQSHPDAHIVVCLHHQPLPVGSAWLDTMELNNGDDFFSILDRHSNVRAVIWGHIHQVFEGERNGVQLLGVPSTCIQFTPNHDAFQIDTTPPGIRWLALLPNGEIRTGVERIAVSPMVDLETAGYV
jgi:Icc protein